MITAASTTMLRGIIEAFRPNLDAYEEIYKELHRNPELSGQEVETASTVQDHLNRLEFTKVIAKMDALPIEEHTGLPYASRKIGKDGKGNTYPVFHGCGHDMHMACLLACADLLSAARRVWRGTLICLFQPGEENFAGAQAMVDDGLYEIIPQPSVLLAQHLSKGKGGTVGTRPGTILAACERFEVRIHGRGGHGSSPANCRDPIVAGAHIVSQLQTVVSREVDPSDFAVVTCGSFNAGSLGASVIPEHADITVDMRSYDPDVGQRVSSAVKRIIEAGCEAAGMPKKPDIHSAVSAPPTTNDTATIRTLEQAFRDYFGESLNEAGRDAASEDFAILAQPFNTPYAYWYLGGTGQKRWDEAERKGKLDEIPGNHSSGFYPDVDPTLRTGTDSMALAALSFLEIQESGL
ncbi:putative zinc metallopeptidase [Melanomma pulvis-pyrius CBS 109.77]|uniref:Putative zinc metallopeptidase n=1 Tax=Melanomma pulvis-pyrius CBS 109.77 TaxID=1314802 RepID=A0A6A6WY62_9PLEO|nr:putative zinc metallopeptidase [Melanomma pulvis-pyrius CBS 109.77]